MKEADIGLRWCWFAWFRMSFVVDHIISSIFTNMLFFFLLLLLWKYIICSAACIFSQSECNIDNWLCDWQTRIQIQLLLGVSVFISQLSVTFKCVIEVLNFHNPISIECNMCLYVCFYCIFVRFSDVSRVTDAFKEISKSLLFVIIVSGVNRESRPQSYFMHTHTYNRR